MNIHMATIQAVEFPNPAATSFMVKMPVRVATVIPVRVTAIIGRGFVIQATMVAIKIANMCQAIKLMAAGLTGDKTQIPIPKIKGRMNPL